MGQWTWNLIGDEPEVVNPPDPNEAFIETGREFLQQLRDKATSVEEVMVPFDLNPSPADTAARKIQERDELKTTS